MFSPDSCIKNGYGLRKSAYPLFLFACQQRDKDYLQFDESNFTAAALMLPLTINDRTNPNPIRTSACLSVEIYPLTCYGRLVCMPAMYEHILKTHIGKATERQTRI